MNERIKQIAEQAAEQVIGIEPEAIMVTETDTAYIEVPSTFILTFAELIVEEVYDYILNATFNDEPWPSRKDVKQHFGVEE